MPLARIALLLSLGFSLANPSRRRAFRWTAPCAGWLVYLALAVVVSALAWAYIDDPLLVPGKGFGKLSKLFWFAAIPLGAAQVDSRTRLIAALKAFLAGACVCAVLVLVRNPLLASFQMAFPTDAQAASGVESGAVTPLGAFLYRAVSHVGRLDAVNKWINTCGRAKTWSQAFVKLGTMQDAQRLMCALPVALGLFLEARRTESGKDVRRMFFSLVLTGVGLVATCKRGPIMAAAAVSFMLMLSRMRWWKALAAALLMVAAVFALPQARERFASLPDEFELRKGGRAMMWTWIVPELHRQHPWGIGFRSLTWEKMSSIDMHIELGQNHVHCTPLQSFVDFGWPGLAAWALWMALAFSGTGRLARLSRRPAPGSSLPETACFAVPLSMLGALFLYGLVEYNLADAEVVLLYGFAMGMCGPSLLRCAPAPESQSGEQASGGAGGGAVRSLALVAILAGGGLACGGCSGRGAAAGALSEPEVPKASAHGAVLVTGGAELDCTADGLPGGFFPVSPDLLPNAATVLTGELPPRHGVRVDGLGALPAELPTVAETLSGRGWDCAAFLADPTLSKTHGLDRGFSEFSSKGSTNRAAFFMRTDADVLDDARRWLAGRSDRKRPVFMWLHFPRLPADWRSALGDLADAFDENRTKTVLAALGPLPGKRAVPEKAPEWAIPRPGDNQDARPTLAAVPAALGGASAAVPAAGPRYWEAVSPWYVFRLPPLEAKGADCHVSVLDGLNAVPPNPAGLAHQVELSILRVGGHLGAGLVPPFRQDSAPAAALADAGRDRIRAWRQATALPPGKGRLDALRSLSESHPDVPLFHEEFGDALLRERDWTAACNEYSAAARIGWNMVRANRMTAKCHVAIGNVPAAIDRAETAFLTDQTDPTTRVELADLLLRTGTALLAAGELREARDCLDRSLLLSPGSAGAMFQRARLDLALGSTNAAVSGLRSLVRLHPGDKPAARLLREVTSAR